MPNAFDAAAIVARSVPILCIDTCSILDIMRDPTREDARPHERRAAIDLVGRLENGEFVCLIAEQVAVEFNTHDGDIQNEALSALQKLRQRVERANDIHDIFLPSVGINLAHLDSQVVHSRLIVGRWITGAISVSGASNILARVLHRVNNNITPARKGKESFKDCVIFETYLDSIDKLRDLGLPSSVVLLSSNTKEYLTEGRQLKNDINSEFLTFNMTFASNMAAAKNLLGF